MTSPAPSTQFDDLGRVLTDDGAWAWDNDARSWVTPTYGTGALSGTADPAAGVDDPSVTPAPADLEPAPFEPAPFEPAPFEPAPVDDEPSVTAVDEPAIDEPSVTAVDEPAPVVVEQLPAPAVTVLDPEPAPELEPVDDSPADGFSKGDFVEYDSHWPAETTQRGIVVNIVEADDESPERYEIAWLDRISGPIRASELRAG